MSYKAIVPCPDIVRGKSPKAITQMLRTTLVHAVSALNQGDMFHLRTERRGEATAAAEPFGQSVSSTLCCTKQKRKMWSH